MRARQRIGTFDTRFPFHTPARFRGACAAAALSLSALLAAPAMAACSTTDAKGNQCIKELYNTTQSDDAGVSHDIAFQNSCDHDVIVDVRRKSGDIVSNEVAAGKQSKLSCVDHEGYSRNCGGFESWKARCE
ncbi:hypothetical protein [Pseudomonas sp.]|uniref:hypothetical protein n=1 Tax=Pseudomonas sp. TaxID=306 RepID=UPI0028ACB237|nr:hypothetical protein [Pseudomonas sp.]